LAHVQSVLALLEDIENINLYRTDEELNGGRTWDQPFF